MNLKGFTLQNTLACFNMYNKPAEVTQFSITDENHKNYFLQGSQYKSISCNHTIEGISIVGNKTISISPLNYSVNFTLYTTHMCDRKIISVNLTVELMPCHPGFRYHKKSQKCKCYDASGIVSCFSSGSVIKRGYWFGYVTGISTVTFCPINYCNFTCCKTINGYYHLSPVRTNQCKSHRSGTACGSCEKDHMLSFDSVDCISIDKCRVDNISGGNNGVVLVCCSGGSVYRDVLSGWYWIFLCHYILLQCGGYYRQSTHRSIQ